MTIAVAAVVACGGSGASTTTIHERGPGASDPVSAVEELVASFADPDFHRAANYAVPGQAALAALAEGASAAQVAEALSSGNTQVAANFWSGFAQGAGAFLTEDLTVSEGETITKDGTEYHTVLVMSETGQRELVVRDVGGYRVDLFASFAPGLAERMGPSVERLLNNRGADSSLILESLGDNLTSLLLAAEREATSPEATQSILRLVELITRVG